MTTSSGGIEVVPGSVERSPKRVRAFSQGHAVVDSGGPLLAWEHPFYPQYAFAPEEFRAEFRNVGGGRASRTFGRSETFDVVVGDQVLARAAHRFPDAPAEAMRQSLLLTWSAFDTWLEEDDVVYTHARSPYVRIDALASSRHVRVVVAGEVVAESRRPVVLFETGLPPRYYLPLPDVRMDLLRRTRTTSQCPYKGEASYWSVVVRGRVLDDVVWCYPTPLPESLAIAGLVAFWPEKSGDLELYVDGKRVGVQR